MRVRGARRLALIAIGLVVTTAAVAANGGAGSSGGQVTLLPVAVDNVDRAGSASRLDFRSPRYERTRLIYDRMNLRAEQLRQEVNKTDPDPAVVADLEAELRSLASRL